MTLNAKKLLKIVSFSVLILFVAIYAFYRSRDLVFGVKIKNVNITDGATVIEKVLPVEGNARNAVLLALDGRAVSIDEEGNFKEEIALFSGYNVVSIKAVDKFGNSDEKNYKLVFIPR